jgi:hypothetical protein
VTRLCDPPLEIRVTLGPEGAPALVHGALNGTLEAVARWVVELDWWRQPVAREYWKALVPHLASAAQPADAQLLVEIFHDLELDTWFLERIYD